MPSPRRRDLKRTKAALFPMPRGAAPRGRVKIGALALLIIIVTSCERVPSKSDYVSAQVTKLCASESGDSLRACRLAVINEFKDTPLEDLQRRFPKPEPRSRPSCGA